MTQPITNAEHTGLLLSPGAELCDELDCPVCDVIIKQRRAEGRDGYCRRFRLHRDGPLDRTTGAIPGFRVGTGMVAEGIRFSDGSAALRWRGPAAHTEVWTDLGEMLAAHGYDTRLSWVDGGAPS